MAFQYLSVPFSFQRLSSSITAAARVIAIISAALVGSSAKTRPLLKITIRRFGRQLQCEVVEMQQGRLTRVTFGLFLKKVVKSTGFLGNWM